MTITTDIKLEIEVDAEEGMLYIGTEDGSGAKYPCKTIEDLKSKIEFYINNYLYDYVKEYTQEENEIVK